MLIRKKHLDIYLISLCLLVAAGVVMRTIAALGSLDYTLGHYSESVLITVANWITAGGTVLLFSYIAIAPRGIKYRADFSGAKTYLPTALVSASLVFLAISLVTDLYRKTHGKIDLDRLRDLTVIMPALSAVLAIISIYYFFLNSYLSAATSTRRAAAAFAAVLFLCVYPAYLYFDTSLPINAPNKVVDQMAYLFCAIFFLYELRISLGRDRWGAYAAFGLISALLTAYSALPSLIVYFVRGEVISNSIAENALTLSLFVFITCRLITVRSLYSDEPCDVVAGVKSRHSARRLATEGGELMFTEGEQLEFEMSLIESEEPEQTPIEEQTAPDDEHVSYESAEELSDIAEEEDEDSIDTTEEQQ